MRKDRRMYFFSFFTYPIASLLITAMFLLTIALLNFVKYRFMTLAFKDVFLVLTLVFSILTVVGMLDGSFFNSKIGLCFAKYFCLIDKKQLVDLVYEKEVEGRIAKGAETIEMALTVISLLIIFCSF